MNTPHPHTRYRQGKNDSIDAIEAARKILSGQACAVAKDTAGIIESIRLILITRRSAVKSRTEALTQLQSIIVTAPDHIRENLLGDTKKITTKTLVMRCRYFRPNLSHLADPVQSSKRTLKSLAQRIHVLDQEISELETELTALITQCAPNVLNVFGVGPISAAQLLVTAGQNITRFTSQKAFAKICGVCPIPVSTGKTHRMRLNKGGDRQANSALHRITIIRLKYDQKTKDYLHKRTQDSLSKKDIIRCLKRYIAKEIYHAIKHDLTQLNNL